MSRKKTSQERMDALRQEPEYRDLLRVLKGHTEDQVDRFSEWSERTEQPEREECDEHGERQNNEG